MKTDGQMLGEFAATRSEEAFAVLVRRHGSMVYNTCLRVIGRAQDAEDAAQACFAILARKAKGFAREADVGGWLHKVAVQIALNLRKSESRRRAREKEAGEVMRKRSSQAGPGWERVSGEVDAALARLSAAQRDAVVGVYLQGRTRAEVAGSLGVPDGTIAWRCQAGLEKLRRLLGRRGVSLGAAALGSMLLENGASAALPASFSALPSLCASFAAKGAAGSAGNSALLLAEGTMKAMFWTKMKLAAAVAVAVTVVAGGGGLAVRLAAGEPAKKLNPTLVSMAPNTWVKLKPNREPVGRSYSGICWGNGRIFYFGGGHHSHPSNDVELYDPAANTWTQATEPEDYRDCDKWPGLTEKDRAFIKSIGGGCPTVAPYVSPKGRPLVYHTYQQHVWLPEEQAFYSAGVWQRGIGLWA
ncbi:MAG: RNA polymerase sigma factor, partial [Planctomycetota bacterium]